MDLDKSFSDKLDREHQWPCDYLFKFVVPVFKKNEFLDLFPGEKFQSKESSGGKYTSLSLLKQMTSSAEVIAIYRKAGKIEGIIAL